MKCVVTGAAGHLGNNLVRALIARGERPKAVIHQDERALVQLDVERVHADVLEPASLSAAFEGADVVFHLAAQISIEARDDASVLRTNVEGARNVADACLRMRVGRLVHFSSIHAFSAEPLEQPVDELRPPTPLDYPIAYDRSKAAGVRAVREVVERGLNAVIVNPTGVIGPHDYRPSPMGQVFLDLSQRKLPGLVDGGFNWVDVRDVAEAAISAATRGRAGDSYLLSGTWVSVPELAQMAARQGGVRPPKLVSPLWLAEAFAPLLVGIARVAGRRPLYTPASLTALRGHRHISNAKAQRELGFAPRPTEQTVRDVYTWFRERGLVA